MAEEQEQSSVPPNGVERRGKEKTRRVNRLAAGAGAMIVSYPFAPDITQLIAWLLKVKWGVVADEDMMLRINGLVGCGIAGTLICLGDIRTMFSDIWHKYFPNSKVGQ